jgi:hypothetical protein
MKEVLKSLVTKADWMRTFVGWTVMGMFCFTVIYVLVRPVPEGNKEIAHLIAGEVIGAGITMLNFYFGSSKGSQDKNEIIKSQNEKINS